MRPATAAIETPSSPDADLEDATCASAHREYREHPPRSSGASVRPHNPRCMPPRRETMSDPIQTSPSGPGMHPNEKTAEILPAETVEESHVQKDPHVSPSAPAVDLAALTDRALHFLATASNETLGACLVGLSAGTYLVLGRVGLLLIGVVGGVVLHAQWEGHARGGSDSSTQNPEARKRELAVDVAHRVLDWRGAASSKEKDDSDSSSIDVQLYAGKQLDYSSFKPETAAALTELTDAVIRDYVKYVQSLLQEHV